MKGRLQISALDRQQPVPQLRKQAPTADAPNLIHVVRHAPEGASANVVTECAAVHATNPTDPNARPSMKVGRSPRFNLPTFPVAGVTVTVGVTVLTVWGSTTVSPAKLPLSAAAGS